MTEEEFILNYLDKHCLVSIDDNSFTIIENGKTTKIFEYTKLFKNIFCDINVKIFNKWSTEKANLLVIDLVQYIDSIDDEKDDILALNKVLDKYKEKDSMVRYTQNFIMEFFIHYRKNNLNTYTDIKEIGFEDTLDSHSYDHTTLDKNLEYLFKDFVIVFDAFNPEGWAIKRIGHGRVTKEDVLNSFVGLTEANKTYINKNFNVWFTNEKINATERMLRK